MGYDISDYEDIDPLYGSLADVDNLIQELQKRGMRLMMDLVVNHTSNEVRFVLFAGLRFITDICSTPGSSSPALRQTTRSGTGTSGRNLV